jgi:hypothetical protein
MLSFLDNTIFYLVLQKAPADNCLSFFFFEGCPRPAAGLLLIIMVLSSASWPAGLSTELGRVTGYSPRNASSEAGGEQRLLGGRDSLVFSPTSASEGETHRFISPSAATDSSLRGHPIKLERYRED